MPFFLPGEESVGFLGLVLGDSPVPWLEVESDLLLPLDEGDWSDVLAGDWDCRATGGLSSVACVTTIVDFFLFDWVTFSVGSSFSAALAIPSSVSFCCASCEATLASSAVCWG